MSDFGARAAKDFHSEAPPETVSPASERYGAVIPSEAFRWDHNSVTLPRGIWLRPGWVLGRILDASTDTTLTYDDGYSQGFVTTGAANKTITLPAAASCKGQVREFWKVDTGAGHLILDGNADELVNGFATMEFWYKGHGVVLYCDGTGWLRIGGTTFVDLPTTQVLTNVDPTTSPQTYNIDVTANVPAGARTVGGYYRFTCTAGTSAVSVARTGGANIAAQQFAQAANKAIATPFEIQLDTSGTFDVVASSSNISDIDAYLTKALYE